MITRNLLKITLCSILVLALESYVQAMSDDSDKEIINVMSLYSPLELAIVKGNVQEIRTLINKEETIDEQKGLIGLAARMGILPSVATLIELGINIASFDSSSKSFTRLSYPDVIDFIKWASSPLIKEYVKAGYCLTIGLEELKQHPDQAEILHYVFNNFELGQLSIEKITIALKAHNNEIDCLELRRKLSGVHKALKLKRSVLIWATIFNHVKLVEDLLKSNMPAAYINGYDQQGNSALIYAAHYGYEHLVKRLGYYLYSNNKLDISHLLKAAAAAANNHSKLAYDLLITAIEQGEPGSYTKFAVID